MTREEIIKEIHYKGIYTNDVKKRLKKLIKKYHPDKNKKDQQTILIIYQIKKELENNTLKPTIEKDNINEHSKKDLNKEEKIHYYFLESMIQKLKIEKEKIQKKLKHLYQRWNQVIEEKNKQETKLEEVNFTISKIEKELIDLVSINQLDKYLIGMTIIIFLFFIITKKIYLIFIIIIILLLEYYNIYNKNKKYKKKKKSLEIKNNKNIKLQKEYNEINNKYIRIEKKQIELKEQEQKINNDIHFYENELSKITSKEKKQEKSNNKSFRK